jgi:hypothetical protein
MAGAGMIGYGITGRRAARQLVPHRARHRPAHDRQMDHEQVGDDGGEATKTVHAYLVIERFA